MVDPVSGKAFKTYVESIAGPDPAVRQQVIADAQTHDATGRAGMAKALGLWNPEITLNTFKGLIFALAR